MAKLHLIANSHLDPVWLWRWKEGFAEIRATFRSALDRLNEFPELKYTSACAEYYQWIEKLDKEMFEEIRQKVKEGRWNIVGGWFVQPDCNIPCGESFARHGLISQRYFKKKFGIIAKTGYNVDSFGHCASIPQIIKRSGMDNYVFMRPMKNEKDLPNDLFMWESADGSRVCSFRISGSYALGVWEKMDVMLDYKAMADEKNQDEMAFFGIGNHGGGPTIALINEINKMNIPDAVYSTPDDYFAGINRENLPVVADELQIHAIGCYSASTFVKNGNRRCENNLLVAEKLCVLAKHLVGTEYPKKRLDKAWKNLLFNHFHDTICGCAVKKAYEDAGYLYGEIMSITEQAINYAVQAIAQKIDTLGDTELPSFKKSGKWQNWRIWEHEVLGTPIVVFNPHTWTVKSPVEITTVATKMTDLYDREIPFQMVRGDQTNGIHDMHHTVFMAEVEPLGYKVYRLFSEKESEASFDNKVIVEGNVMENSKIRVEFSKVTGDICRLYDKAGQKYLIDGECKAILLDDSTSDTWAHGKKNLGELVGMFDTPEFKVIEDGNIYTTLRVMTYYQQSVLQRDYVLMPDSDRILVKAKVDFHEKFKALKLTFPKIGNYVTAKIPYGTIQRGEINKEFPCGSWIASDRLCVANDCKYGYDTTENEMRMTVLRSTLYAFHFSGRDEFCEFMDMGVHEFNYLVCPYVDNAEAERCASELNFGLIPTMESFHRGPLPLKFSGYDADADNIVVTAVKQAEDGDNDVIRFVEMNGENHNVSLEIFGKTIAAEVRHHEIKTFKSDRTEVNLIEW